jgi:hypothetical protein
MDVVGLYRENVVHLNSMGKGQQEVKSLLDAAMLQGMQVRQRHLDKKVDNDFEWD